MSQEEDNEMEEDEERAVEEALEEAEFMENVQAATENTWLRRGWKAILCISCVKSGLFVSLFVCLSAQPSLIFSLI